MTHLILLRSAGKQDVFFSRLTWLQYDATGQENFRLERWNFIIL